MPLYEYRCVKCDQTFLIKQELSDVRTYSCELCGKPCKRVFLLKGVSFRGSGWGKD